MHILKRLGNKRASQVSICQALNEWCGGVDNKPYGTQRGRDVSFRTGSRKTSWKMQTWALYVTDI